MTAGKVVSSLISTVLLLLFIGLAFSTMFGLGGAVRNLTKLILAVLLAAIATTLLVKCWLVVARVAVTIAVAALMLFMGIKVLVNAFGRSQQKN